MVDGICLITGDGAASKGVPYTSVSWAIASR
jgi:hypothetical protein